MEALYKDKINLEVGNIHNKNNGMKKIEITQ